MRATQQMSDDTASPGGRQSLVAQLRADLLEFRILRNSADGWSSISGRDMELIKKAEALISRAETDSLSREDRGEEDGSNSV